MLSKIINLWEVLTLSALYNADEIAWHRWDCSNQCARVRNNVGACYSAGVSAWHIPALATGISSSRDHECHPFSPVSPPPALAFRSIALLAKDPQKQKQKRQKSYTYLVQNSAEQLKLYIIQQHRTYVQHQSPKKRYTRKSLPCVNLVGKM